MRLLHLLEVDVSCATAIRVDGIWIEEEEEKGNKRSDDVHQRVFGRRNSEGNSAMAFAIKDPMWVCVLTTSLIRL